MELGRRLAGFDLDALGLEPGPRGLWVLHRWRGCRRLVRRHSRQGRGAQPAQLPALVSWPQVRYQPNDDGLVLLVGLQARQVIPQDRQQPAGRFQQLGRVQVIEADQPSQC